MGGIRGVSSEVKSGTWVFSWTLGMAPSGLQECMLHPGFVRGPFPCMWNGGDEDTAWDHVKTWQH